MFDRSSVIARLKQRSKSFWIVAALVLLLVILSATSAGFAGVLIILGIVALITGLYALIFKRQSWVGLPHRKSAGLVTAAGVVVLMVGGSIGAATATPDSVPAKSALVAPSKPSPSATSPSNSPCTTAGESQKYNDKLFICTMGSSERLVWLDETESKRVVALKVAADKAAADKVAADKVAADKAAADKVIADKAAADKVIADKAAADKVIADKAAAAKAAADQAAAAKAAADKAAADKAAAVKAAPAPYVPPAPAAAYYANCTAVKAAGAAPIYAGQPGYSRSLDRDGDGIACEK